MFSVKERANAVCAALPTVSELGPLLLGRKPLLCRRGARLDGLVANVGDEIREPLRVVIVVGVRSGCVAREPERGS